MTKPVPTRSLSPEKNRKRLDANGWRQALEGTNINPATLLATDYLNHFNEAIMILDLAAEIPDCLEEIIDWAPKSYQEHFTGGHFPHKDLAIAAYKSAAVDRRKALESVVDDLNLLILCTVSEATTGDSDMTSDKVSTAATEMRRLITKASAIINGASLVPLAGTARDQSPATGMSQDAVDSLFD